MEPRNGTPWTAVRTGTMRPRRGMTGMFAAVAAAAILAGCGESGVAMLDSEPRLALAQGHADDGSPDTPPASYGTGDSELWAADSLTTAFADPPLATRVSGGVAAQPVDTVIGAGVGTLAEATSRSRARTPLTVEEAGRFSFNLALDLHDVQLGNDGRAAIGLRALVLDDRGEPVPAGEIGTITLEVRADGSVIVDGLEQEPEYLQPNFGFSRSINGPRPGVELDRGPYLVEIELFIQATAPVAAGGYQLASVGHAVGRLDLRR